MAPVNSRAALIAAALEEFTDKGYETATLASIAERAGVTTGAVYAHFRGKLDLFFEAVGIRSVDRVMHGTLADAAAKPSLDAAAVLGRDLARPVAPESLLLLDVLVLARRDPRLATTMRRLMATKLEAWTAAAEAGRAAGAITSDLDAEDIAALLALLAVGKMALAIVQPRPPSAAALMRIGDAMLTGAGDGSGSADPLSAVATEAARAMRARADFEAAVVAASEAGHSLRQVAEAAGVSHEQIRRIVADKRASA
jgi:AcrR family transcriptional regulator